MSPITLSDVAKKAGVSKKTVSRVLNNEPNVAEKTFKKVQSAIDELNYVPNASARRLSTGKARTIGVIVGWPIYFHYISKMIEYAFKESLRYGYSLSLFSIHEHDVEHIVDAYHSKQVDGFILDTPSSMDQHLYASLKSIHAPYVVINPSNKKEHLQASIIEINDMESTRKITEYLISLGHRNIGYVSANIHIVQQVNRIEGYKQALQQTGIPFREEYTLSEARITLPLMGVDQGKQLMEKYPEITAIIAGNDDIALGIYRAAWQKGLKVPDDISVVGFDDNYYTGMSAPPLTTIHQPVDEMASHAVQLLIRQIEEPNSQPLHKILSTELVIRESCKAPREEVGSKK
jgi:DNA-binding LacI/PurR family transcriptional regulator